MENYIVINGKKIEFTEKQLKQLGLELKKTNDIFDRATPSTYFFINSYGEIIPSEDDDGISNKKLFGIGNYCRDRNVMRQRALYEILNRKLWRFSIENKDENSKEYYFIVHDNNNINPNCYVDSFIPNDDGKNSSFPIGAPIFSSKDIAQRAIDEIIDPFLEEHSGFVF